jgi:hypothetical protein
MEIVDLILILIVSVAVQIAVARLSRSVAHAINPPRTDDQRQNRDGMV